MYETLLVEKGIRQPDTGPFDPASVSINCCSFHVLYNSFCTEPRIREGYFR